MTRQPATLDDYRQVMAALDRADADLVEGDPIDYHRLTVEHLTNIRDAVENSLFNDHNRLGFASEHPAAKNPPEPANPPGGARLSRDDVEAIRASTGPARTVAERYGVSKAHVYRIRRKPVAARPAVGPRLSPQAVEAVRTSKCSLRVLAERYGVSISYLGKIRSGR